MDIKKTLLVRDVIPFLKIVVCLGHTNKTNNKYTIGRDKNEYKFTVD